MDEHRTEHDDLALHTEKMRARARNAGIPEVDIDDVVGEALLVACKQDQPRPPPECVERVVAWLLELVDWQVMAHWTRRARRSRESLWPDPEAEQLVADSRDHERVIEARQQVKLALQVVPVHLAEVVIARWAYGMRIREFACETGISKSTASSWFQRGEQELRNALVALDKPRRRRGVVLPFSLPLGSWLPSALRGLGRILQSVFSKVVPGIVAGAALVAFTPSSLDATAGEGEMQAAEREPQRIEERRFTLAPTSASGAPEKYGAVSVPPRCAVESPKAPPARKQGERAAKPKRPSSDPGLLTLLMAKSAFQQGNAAKAKTLLEADAAARPDSPDQREREILRALANP